MAEFKRFIRRIEKSDESLLRASQLIRKEVLTLIDEGFRNRVDPIGRKWADRKSWYQLYLKRGGTPYPLMNKTLSLRQGWFFRVGKKAVTFGNDKPYARWHQDGTRKMVARKMVPDKRLSPKWRFRISKVLPQALAEHFRGR